MGNCLQVGILGFRGYSGAELVRLLTNHHSVQPVLLEHRHDAGDRPQPVGNNKPARIPGTVEAIAAAGLAAVFLATPPEVSMEISPGLLRAGIKVIDLSGAFRLKDAQTYSRWYKENHAAPELLPQAVYGLPEVNRAKVAGACLISNPGCYPTAANLAIRPLVDSGVLDRQAGIVCDAKSGVSGAGRKPTLKTSFCEVTDNFSAYSVLNHRHVPEVLMVSGLFEREFSFTAQLLPLDRGILETIYFRAENLDGPAALFDLYSRYYANEPFVRVYNAGEFPDLRSVQRTNFCDIGFTLDPATGRAVVVSAIDNLGKGAAGQAIQNMNLMFGFPETQGLL